MTKIKAIQQIIKDYSDTLILYANNPKKLEQYRIELNTFLCYVSEHELNALWNEILRIGKLKKDFPKRRYIDFIDARKAFCYIACIKWNKEAIHKYSLSEIGKIIAKDHSTVLHHYRTFKDRLSVDKKFKNDFFEKYGHLL